MKHGGGTWLASHIRGMDSAFADYVKRGGLAGPAA
jgi:hemerythrin